MKILLLLLLPCILQAQTFSGYYALTNWNVIKSAVSTGSINYADAPNAIIINGSSGIMAENIDTDLSIAIDRPGVYSFEWEYSTEDILPRYDIAGVLINGSFLQLCKNNDGSMQSGKYTSAHLDSGTTLGFRIRSADNLNGRATLKIKSFTIPIKEIIVQPTEPPINNCDIRFYPNPVYTTLRISLGCYDGTISVILYTATGQALKQLKTNHAYIDLDMSFLPAGIYLVKARDKISKIVKQ